MQDKRSHCSGFHLPPWRAYFVQKVLPLRNIFGSFFALKTESGEREDKHDPPLKSSSLILMNESPLETISAAVLHFLYKIKFGIPIILRGRSFTVKTRRRRCRHRTGRHEIWPAAQVLILSQLPSQPKQPRKLREKYPAWSSSWLVM